MHCSQSRLPLRLGVDGEPESVAPAESGQQHTIRAIATIGSPATTHRAAKQLPVRRTPGDGRKLPEDRVQAQRTIRLKSAGSDVDSFWPGL